MKQNDNYALEIQGLSKVYDNGKEALSDVSFQVEAGDVFALLGPNGAGKTTTIGILTSLVAKSAGRVKIFGIDIDQDFSAAKRLLGVVPQEYNFDVFQTVLQVVLNQAGYYGIPRKRALPMAKTYLQKLDLWSDRQMQMRHLSGGMKRRVMFARGLVHQPKMLILDEPTAGVDVELRRTTLEFIKTINQQGTTVILTTHYLEEAEQLCQHIAILNQGKIVVNTEMNQLIRQIQKETLILNLASPLPHGLQLPDYQMTTIDSHTLEISLSKAQNLNQLFQTLANHQVHVLSMKNKANRLEEIFVQLTGKAS